MTKLIIYAVCVVVQALILAGLPELHETERSLHLPEDPPAWPMVLTLGWAGLAFALHFARVWKTAQRTKSADRRELLREIERAERGR